MAIHIDQSCLPLIVIKYDGPTTDENFEAYLATLYQSMTASKAGPRVLLQDATLAYPITARQRKRQADWMKEYSELIARMTLGCAFVIPSSLMRGVLTAIFWLQPLPCPHELSANMAEGLSWCEQKLATRGFTLPAAAQRFAAATTTATGSS